MDAKDMVLAAPDTEQPDRMFVDGPYVYEVLVLPYRAPWWGVPGAGQTPGLLSGLTLVGYAAASQWAAKRLDSRYKVLVVRRNKTGLGRWRLVLREPATSATDADEKRRSILCVWPPQAIATTNL